MKTAIANKADVEEMLTGIRNHIINPFIRIVKWTAVAFVIVNLLMLIFGESRLIDCAMNGSTSDA